MEKKSIYDVRQNNKKLIIDKILNHPGISRLELSEITGLSTASITSFTKELINENIIKETKKRKSTGGRPKIGLEIDLPENQNIIFEIKYRTLKYKYYINNFVKKEKIFYFDYLDGNYLVDKISDILSEFDNTFSNVVILLEENIQENEITYLYGSSIFNESISFISALKLKTGKDIIIENNLKYVLNEEILNIQLEKIHLYAYVSIDENLLTHIFENGKQLYFANDIISKFYLSKVFEINNNSLKWENLYTTMIHDVRKTYFNYFNIEKYYKSFLIFLKQALENMLIFYNLDAIFLIGNSIKFPNLDKDLQNLINTSNRLKIIQTIETEKVDITNNLNNILLKNKLLGGKE